MVCGKDRCQIGTCMGVQNIPWSHEIYICHPIPGIPFFSNEEPPRTGCQDSIRSLNNYPVNQATTKDGSRIVFGASEMVMLYAKFHNYTAAYPVTLSIHRPDGSEIYKSTYQLPQAHNAFLWGVVGRYSSASGYSNDEIIMTGEYKAEIRTKYGAETLKFYVGE